MSNILTRAILALAATVAVVLPVTSVTNASASTNGCTQGAYAGYCSTQTNADVPALSFDVYRQRATVNNKIIGYTNAITDKATDFFTYAYQGGTTKVFEYAPNGVASNLCISEPNVDAGLVLRGCNGSAFQRFTAVPVTNSQFTGPKFTWRNEATGDVITANGMGGQLTGVLPVGGVGVPPAAEQWRFDG